MDDKTYEDQDVYLADLLDRALPPLASVLEGFTFRRCRLFGPAVIALLGGQLTDLNLGDPDVDAVLWPIADGAEKIGMIVLRHCTIEQCRLEGVGIAAWPEIERQLRDAFGG